MKEKPRRSWKQRVISVLVCFCASWLVCIEALNLIAWHFARETSRAHRNLNVLPKPVPDTSVAELAGSRIERFGFSFQVPWENVEQDRTAKSIAVVSFKEGGELLIFDPVFEADGAKNMRGTTSQQQKVMSDVLGSRTLSSNYDLMAAEVQATPAEVKWWATRTQNTRNIIMLMNKSTNIGDADVIYTISSSSMRGFQYGDPSVPPYVVKLDLFDGADKHYKIMVTGKNQHRSVISQAQINALVASVHPLPSQVVSSSASNGD